MRLVKSWVVVFKGLKCTESVRRNNESTQEMTECGERELADDESMAVKNMVKNNNLG
jgi:hypothetical protein